MNYRELFFTSFILRLPLLTAAGLLQRSVIILAMLSPQEIEARLERVLLKVQKPGRYVDGERNAVVRNWQHFPVKVAFLFPDIYDLGISNLGLQILYDEVNRRPDALAERAYAPWVDLETEMRRAGIPLYALESNHPLAVFDMLAFSLPYETLYTNTLNMLDLAGLPLRSADRNENHPLVIAGGHACFNPEPMHAFMDAFVIGEGEQVIHEILDLLLAFKTGAAGRKNPSKRADLLAALAKIPGVYVPGFYTANYHPDGTFASLTALTPEVPATIFKRMVALLPPPVTNFLVPNIEVVHERISMEVMRGCARGCRFCQAGFITRPVRERSVEEILAAAEQAVRLTGMEELALLSLSSSDHTSILELVDRLSGQFAGRHLTISLPSLRIDTVSVDLMEKLKSRRSGGFTLAPEAASGRMRNIINKSIPDEALLETARAIYSRGWANLKLYFMIGHPAETLEDVSAIAALCKKVLAQGRATLGGRAHLHAGVSTFIPKPHTPFQWAAVDSPEQIQAKQALLMQELRGPAFKLTWTAPQDTLLEAFLSRGDRRIAEVIQGAWKNGAKFDAWQEQRNFDAWLSAFEAAGLSPAFYTHRERSASEAFPWDHISAGVRKRYLLADYQRSLRGETRPDCSTDCDGCGILTAFAAERRANPGQGWKCPEVKSRTRTKPQPAGETLP